jgi:hypothetical protein
MNMDKDQELRNRIAASNPGDSDVLPEYLVAQATQHKPKRTLSFRTARFAVGTGSFAAVALVAGLTLPSAFAPQPLFTMAGGSGNAMTAAESAPMAADAKVGMIWPGYVTYNYLTDGLSDETGSGHIYQAQLVGDPKQILGQLMEVFGVKGEIVKDEWSTDQFPSFSVQSKDGSNETYLSIYWSGTGNWNYSRWDSSLWSCAEPEPAADGAGSSSSDGSTDEARSCSQPEATPELIPSEAQMRQEAAELFATFGIAIDAASFKTYRDDWGGSAYAELEFQGQPLPVSISVGWDLRGEISYASGHSFEMIDRGEFKTVSALDAVERIKEGNWYGSAPSSYYENQVYSSMARDGVAVAPAPEVDSGETAGSAANTGEASSEPAIEPLEEPIAIGEPAPGELEEVEPQIIDLTINKAEVAMLGVWDANGGFWLVPGYILHNDQGWFDSIISVIEGVIELPKYEDLMIEPMPATKEG